MTRKELGREFVKLRRAAGLTQTDVALKLGYTSPQFISNTERGLCMLPPHKAVLFGKMVGVGRDAMFRMYMYVHQRELEKEFGV